MLAIIINLGLEVSCYALNQIKDPSIRFLKIVVSENSAQKLLKRVQNLNVYRKGERRAPHKPLLVLLALGRLRHGQRRIPFNEIESALLPLLKAYAPPVSGRHQPELPYWHLQSDGFWEVDRAAHIPRQAGGFPRMAALRETTAGFTEDTAEALSNQKLAAVVVTAILDEHFPPSLHEDIIAAVGLDPGAGVSGVEEMRGVWRKVRTRAPAFRDSVLRAYEHRCAVTGFRAALAGSYFGCEAAHLQWHARGGPDTVANGICLEPTLHKLLDAGAWSLTDDHRILVSAEYTGSDAAVTRLREKHGGALRAPILGEPEVSIEYIRWHREPELGGVFRKPALRL